MVLLHCFVAFGWWKQIRVAEIKRNALVRKITGGEESWRQWAEGLRGCAMGWAAVARPAGGVTAHAKLEAWPPGGAATADSPAPRFFLPLYLAKKPGQAPKLYLKKVG